MLRTVIISLRIMKKIHIEFEFVILLWNIDGHLKIKIKIDRHFVRNKLEIDSFDVK